MNLRDEIEKILAETIYGIPYEDCDGGRKGMTEEGMPLIKATILEAIEKEMPKEKDYVGFVSPHTGTDKPDGEVFGYAKEIEAIGYNQALADCLETVKEVLK